MYKSWAYRSSVPSVVCRLPSAVYRITGRDLTSGSPQSMELCLVLHGNSGKSPSIRNSIRNLTSNIQKLSPAVVKDAIPRSVSKDRPRALLQAVVLSSSRDLSKLTSQVFLRLLEGGTKHDLSKKKGGDGRPFYLVVLDFSVQAHRHLAAWQRPHPVLPIRSPSRQLRLYPQIWTEIYKVRTCPTTPFVQVYK